MTFMQEQLLHTPETIIQINNLISRIKSLAEKSQKPIFVAIDGRSGTGKSTIGKHVARELSAAYIETDYFWTGGDNLLWDERSPQERAELAIDWKRLKEEVLKPLSAGINATWRPYDFVTGNGLSETAITQEPVNVVIVDGAYAARPELRDMINLTVLIVSVDDQRRRNRLVEREGNEYMSDWHNRWDPAEDYYFSTVATPEKFDIIIENG